MRQIRSALSGAAAPLAATVLIAGLPGCGGPSDTSTPASGRLGRPNVQLSLVAYSTAKPAYDALTAAFATTPAGRGVRFSESFGASGAQSRAVAAGQPADVVAFSTVPDVTRLVKAGIVSARWDANREHGIVSDSVVVLVVRKGNPKHIRGWTDLLRPGIEVITPNPSTSGSARWNILAAYGSQLEQGRTRGQALGYVRKLLTEHVSVQDPSGSAAMQTFASGKGDVLLSYESEAIAAAKAGLPIQYIVPRQTILIQTPVAVVAGSSHAAQARAFVRWLWTPAAQTIWAQDGYRPVLASVLARFAHRFPTPPQLFTISLLGGWSNVNRQLFDPSQGAITKIERAAGVPTASN
jgi:sulfate/thiosulfate-binding protein